MKNEFTTFEVVVVFGISRDRIQVWLDRGFIKPSAHKARGQGDKNLFNREDLYRIGLFEKLNELGFRRIPSAELAAQGIGCLEGKRAARVALGSPLIKIVIDLQAIKTEVDKKIRQRGW